VRAELQLNESFSKTHYFYFIFKLATCFDSRVSSSGLRYELTYLKSCVYSWEYTQPSKQVGS